MRMMLLRVAVGFALVAVLILLAASAFAQPVPCLSVSDWMFQAGLAIGRAGKPASVFRHLQGSTAQAVFNRMADRSKEGRRRPVDGLLIVFGDQKTSVGIITGGKVCINLKATPSLVNDAIRDTEGVSL